MAHRVLTALTGVVALLSLVTAVLLVIPVEFHARAGRKVERVDWTKLVCSIPWPNLNVTYDQLTQHWNLPQTVRLSPRMADVARCAVALQRRNWKKNGVYRTDSGLCLCVNMWWVLVVATVALMMAFCNGIDFLLNLLCVNGDRGTAEEQVRRRARLELFRNIIFGLTYIAFGYNQHDQLSYTSYGDIFPTSYFHELPGMWVAALCCWLAASILQSVCFFAYAACDVKIRPNENNRCHGNQTNQGKRVVEVFVRYSTRKSFPSIAPSTEQTIHRNTEESNEANRETPSKLTRPSPPMAIKNTEQENSTDSDTIIIPYTPSSYYKEHGPQTMGREKESMA